jgi:pimeloyl-ACP methyl ester carboxylesterase/predicted glycosyltransferase
MHHPAVEGDSRQSPGGLAREQSRARRPEAEGFVERDGVRIFWERYGEGQQTLLFLPTWSLVHSRTWKAQIPYLSRHARVLAFDPRGNGRSDRPASLAAYSEREFVRDALDVLDANGVRRCVLVGLSRGAQRALLLAAHHPERVDGLALVAPMFPASALGGLRWRILAHPLLRSLADRRPLLARGWGKFNAWYMRAAQEDFVRWFVGKMLPEPHSTKQFEDAVGWGLETDGETLRRSALGNLPRFDRRTQRELARRVRCPVLVIHGDRDRVTAVADGRALARETGGEILVLPGAGHLPQARKPVAVNLALRAFLERAGEEAAAAPRPPARRVRPKRALYLSSPIGLGHAQRDVAIARELRALHPGLEIDWLAQDPVTRVLAAEGERIHPASASLASESQHIESESSEHDLHCFQAWRRMDEILVSNFMVFHDLVREERYDVWIGDEAWELDYFLHENPGEKRAPYAWMTDFVGWLPMADGGRREVTLTADYNAEMIEHIARHPQVRDRAIFVGNPEDIVPDALGPGLPRIRDWTERHFAFAGYVSGFDPAAFGDRQALRAEVGFRPDERVCIVAVGGSGVGAHLLRRAMAAFPEAKRRLPDLRMIVVAGPRIDPASLPHLPGLEVRAYVHNLYRHLAACDLAVVQGGLSTAMELTAAKRPFLYFPLRHHFEQSFHVRHRLDRYGAGRCMDYETATPEEIAAAIERDIGRPMGYRDVETDGARRAAEHIAELL